MSERITRPRGEQADDLGDHLLVLSSPEHYPVVDVHINSLVFDNSPRLDGVNPQHAHLLAESYAELPPIVVHQPTMRVIDGMHRIHAAVLTGRSTIRACLLDCDEETAFVLAVRANVTHGLPLSSADRKAAAARILAAHPQWSDRAVAAASGLSYKTVARVRSCAAGNVSQLNAVRVGRDRRQHPLNTAAKRLQAAAMINGNPDAGLREVARVTGLSPATVRDVRERTQRGEDPVPARYRRTSDSGPVTEPTQEPARKPGGRPVRREVRVDQGELLTKLRGDPSMRLSENGRGTLRWLAHHVVDAEGVKTLDLNVPDHWTTTVAELAWSCADAWIALAEQLEQRAHAV
jgi:ParB-like chromosome segregation protein Spo0J